MVYVAFVKAEHIITSMEQAIAMHMALERQRQPTVGKSSASHVSQARNLPVCHVCL